VSAPPPLRATSLQGLKALKRRLEDAARLQAEQIAAQREREAATRRERELFARSVGPVVPLKPSQRVHLARPRPAPEPLQRRLDERAVLREALSDDFDVETLLDTDDALSWRRPGIGPAVVTKLRRGGWANQAQVDLHGLRRDEAREALAAFLRDAIRRGWRCVRVVHGKGLGSPGKTPVLKGKVQGWLMQKDEVLAFVQARGDEGGAGAVVVLLRPARVGAATP
jgi:DNA-nicking Smr family endonuclease